MKELLVHIIKEQIPVQVMSGKVVSVDEAQAVCDVEIDRDLTLYDVRIRAVADGQDKGLIIVPAVGSYVLVGLINNDFRSAFVVLYSEVEKVIASIDQSGFEMTAEGFKVERNGENLARILSDMIDELNKIVVVQGNTINVAAMTVIKQRLNNVLKQ